MQLNPAYKLANLLNAFAFWIWDWWALVNFASIACLPVFLRELDEL